MNYLELILQFWKLRRSKRITSKQADLYFYLLQECNERNWENPFECSNKLICAAIDISEPVLIDSRNRLQQVGLIEFSSGKRNERSPVYRLINLKSNLKKLSRNRDESLDEPLDEPEMKASPIKNKPNQTKQIISGDGAPGPQKKKVAGYGEKNQYWKEFVKTFDDWYLSTFKEPYNYLGQDWSSMDRIYKFLKKRSEAKKVEWNEEYMKQAFGYFLEKAWSKDNWLRENFSLSNLLSQFNQIVNSNKLSDAKNGASTTGSNTGALGNKSGGFGLLSQALGKTGS